MDSRQNQTFAQVQHLCENLLKRYSHEAVKLENNFIPNPKSTQMFFANWQVDIEKNMEKIKKQDMSFYNLIKGKIHSFETAAKHFVQHYKTEIQQTDFTEKEEYLKKIQTDIEEMQRFLDDLFKNS